MINLMLLLFAPWALAKSPGYTDWIRCEGERGSVAEFTIVVRERNVRITDVNLRGPSGRTFRTRSLDMLEAQTQMGGVDYAKIGRTKSRQIVFQYQGRTLSFCFDESDQGTCKVVAREELPDPEVERERRRAERNEPRLSCPPEVARQVGGCAHAR